MKNIKILGSCNCQCKSAYEVVEKAIKENGLEATVTTETDIMELMKYGIMSTPAIVIDGKVVFVGGTPSSDDIKKWFE